MKRINNYFKNIALVVVSALALSSCGDWLELEPKDRITEDNFWNEKTDVIQYLLGAYTDMQSSTFLERCIIWGEGRSDNFEISKEIGGGSLYDSQINNILTTSAFTHWSFFYRVINRCNVLIEKAPEVARLDPSFKQSELNAAVAEASAIRALCYFYLVRAFGEVPLIKTAVTQEDQITYPTQSSTAQILDWLIEDLQSKAGMAYTAFPQSDLGENGASCNRITRTAIYAMLADMCLWRERYDDAIMYSNMVIDKKFEDYLEYAKDHNVSRTSGGIKLISYPGDEDAPYDAQYGSGYPLYTCYSNFISATTANFGYDYSAIFGTGNSFESIFELNFESTSDRGESYKGVPNATVGLFYGQYLNKEGFTGVGTGHDGIGQLAPYKDLVAEISPTKSTTKNEDNKNCYLSEQDVRYYYNFVPQNDYQEGLIGKYVYKTVDLTASNRTKFDKKNFYPNVASPTNYRESNWIFYRLTDVMLMKAEALIEKIDTTNMTEVDTALMDCAFNLIWVVQHRSNMESGTQCSSVAEYESRCPHTIKRSDYGTQEAFRKLLLQERRRELIFEGKRWFDLLRYAYRDFNGFGGEYIRTACSAKYSSTSELFMSKYSLYWPVNKNEKKTNPNLRQNPYYMFEESE